MSHGVMNPFGMALNGKLIVSLCQLVKATCVGLLWEYYLLFAIRNANNMPCLRHSDKHARFYLLPICHPYGILIKMHLLLRLQICHPFI
jgi:hypothetical protein